MRAHAEVICQSKGDVLNVGFGMGIVDGFIQELSPKSHTIIEAHPAVYAKMLADGWDKKPRVSVLFGRWEDVVPTLERQFDGVFFDTFDDDFEAFHAELPRLLRPGGVYVRPAYPPPSLISFAARRVLSLDHAHEHKHQLKHFVTNRHHSLAWVIIVDL